MSTATCQPSKTGTVVRAMTLVATASLALMLGACAQDNTLNLGLDTEKPKVADIATASANAGERPEAELEKATAYWADQHSKNPRDPKAAIAYAKNLKALGRKSQALGVMQASYMFAPDDKEFLSEYGRLALEAGQVSTAGELLARADDPGKPDWKILSARGTVFAKQGRVKEAIDYFERARALAPQQASVLNNLAMAYTMDGQAAKGEELLRQAQSTGTADDRVKQNLALVMDLQSKGAGKAGPAVAQAPQGADATSAPAVGKGVWDKPLPIETASAPTKAKAGKSKAAPAATAAKPLDPDQVIQQAMAAEQAKGGQR